MSDNEKSLIELHEELMREVYLSLMNDGNITSEQAGILQSLAQTRIELQLI